MSILHLRDEDAAVLRREDPKPQKRPKTYFEMIAPRSCERAITIATDLAQASLFLGPSYQNEHIRFAQIARTQMETFVDNQFSGDKGGAALAYLQGDEYVLLRARAECELAYSYGMLGLFGDNSLFVIKSMRLMTKGETMLERRPDILSHVRLRSGMLYYLVASHQAKGNPQLAEDALKQFLKAGAAAAHGGDITRKYLARFALARIYAFMQRFDDMRATLMLLFKDLKAVKQEKFSKLAELCGGYLMKKADRHDDIPEDVLSSVQLIGGEIERGLMRDTQEIAIARTKEFEVKE